MSGSQPRDYSKIAFYHPGLGRQVFTHPSLMESNRFEQFKGMMDFNSRLLKISQVLSIGATIALFRRVPQLKSLGLPIKLGVGAFVGFPIFNILINSFLFKAFSPNFYPLLNGVAFWDKPEDVVNLSTAFFHLDDDQNFKPSLWHHGVTHIVRAEKIFYSGLLDPIDQGTKKEAHH